MNKMLLKQYVLILFSSSLVACATSEETVDDAGYPEESSRIDCISEMSIRDYRVLDDANLIVSGGGNRVYHVVLSRRAFGLRSTWRIGFESRSGHLSHCSIHVSREFTHSCSRSTQPSHSSTSRQI